MSKKIMIRFEPGSNVDFVGGDCVAAYEAAIVSQLSEALGAEIELAHDGAIGTRIYGDFDSPQERRDAEDMVYAVMQSIGNNLTEICA